MTATRALVRWGAALLVALAVVVQTGAAQPASAMGTIDPFTGNFVYYETDFSALSGSNSGLTFRRTYNGSDQQGRSLGPGWSHRFEVRLAHAPGRGPDDFAFFREDGQPELYSARPDGTWEPAATAKGTLEKEATPFGDQYVVRHPFETVYRFRGVGPAYHISFAKTWDLLLEHDADGRVLTVTNLALGSRLRFRYSEDRSRLVTVSDELPQPRAIRFDYDEQGRLASITNRVGAVTSYDYFNETHLLREVVNARGGIILRAAYLGGDTPAQLWNGYGVKTGAYTTGGRTYLPDGTVQARQLISPSSFAPTSPTTILETFDPQGRLLKRETGLGPGDEPRVELFGLMPNQQWGVIGWAGAKTPSPADGQPLTEVRIPAQTQPQPITVGGENPPPALGDGHPRALAYNELLTLKGKSTEQSVDRAGRFVGLVVPASAGPLAGIWRVTYDEDDKILALTQRGAEERTTTFRYDELGNLLERLGPDGSARRFAYDDVGGMISYQDVTGVTRQYEWDERSMVTRMTETSADGSSSRSYEYLLDGLYRVRVVRDVTDPASPTEIELAYDTFTVTGIWQR